MVEVSIALIAVAVLAAGPLIAAKIVGGQRDEQDPARPSQ
jgi:hypothetical protein